jgi:hypothetical protein
MFFLLLPIPLIGFRRRLVEIGRLRTSTFTTSHRHRLYAFPVKPHEPPSRADVGKRLQVACLLY